MGACFLCLLALLHPALAQNDQPALYWQADSATRGVSYVQIPEEDLPEAINRMEQATYVDLAQRYVEQVKRRNREGILCLWGTGKPSRLIEDPVEKAKALERERFRLAQAQAFLDLATDMNTRGIMPPPYLKDKIILQMPDIHMPLDDLGRAFREDLVTNQIVVSLSSSPEEMDAPLAPILEVFAQKQRGEASSRLPVEAQLVGYGKLRTLFVPLQLSFAVGGHDYFLVYVAATDGPAPCVAGTCHARHYLLESVGGEWLEKTHPLPAPVRKGIDRALPVSCFRLRRGRMLSTSDLSRRPTS